MRETMEMNEVELDELDQEIEHQDNQLY